MVGAASTRKQKREKQKVALPHEWAPQSTNSQKEKLHGETSEMLGDHAQLICSGRGFFSSQPKENKKIGGLSAINRVFSSISRTHSLIFLSLKLTLKIVLTPSQKVICLLISNMHTVTFPEKLFQLNERSRLGHSAGGCVLGG